MQENRFGKLITSLISKSPSTETDYWFKMFSRSQLWSLLSKQRTAVCSQRRFIHQTLLKSGASTPATTANDGGQHHGNDGHGEPERHVRKYLHLVRV